MTPNSLLSELSFIGRQLIHSLFYSRLGYWVLHQFFSAKLPHRGKRIDTRLRPEKQLYRTIWRRLRTDAVRVEAASIRQRQNALAIVNAHNATFTFRYNLDPDSACFALICLHEHRDDLFTHLIQSGIGAGKHFQHASAWASAFGYQRGSCPTFDRLVGQIVTIPCHDALTPTDLSTISQSLAQYAQRAAPREQRPAFS